MPSAQRVCACRERGRDALATPDHALDRWRRNVIGSAAQVTSGVRIYDGGALAKKKALSRSPQIIALAHLASSHTHHSRQRFRNCSEGNYALSPFHCRVEMGERKCCGDGAYPSRITIFGESAGAVNVCSLVASPLAKGRSKGRSCKVGGCVVCVRVDAESQGLKVFTAAKCNTVADPLACMRALSAEAVVGALPIDVDVAGAGGGYSAVNDGYVETGKPLELIKSGNHAKVPMLVGSNSLETSRTVPLAQTATEAQYIAAVARSPQSSRMLCSRPIRPRPTLRLGRRMLHSRPMPSGCSARKTVRALSASSTPAYSVLLLARTRQRATSQKLRCVARRRRFSTVPENCRSRGISRALAIRPWRTRLCIAGHPFAHCPATPTGPRHQRGLPYQLPIRILNRSCPLLQGGSSNRAV